MASDDVWIRGADGSLTQPFAPLATYTLQLFGPRHSLLKHGVMYRVAGLPSALIQETEENLTDLLPEGYSVRIKEWDDEHNGA